MIRWLLMDIIHQNYIMLLSLIHLSSGGKIRSSVTEEEEDYINQQ